MSERKRGKDPDDFASLVADAKPLKGRDRQAPPPAPKRPGSKRRNEVRFVFPDSNNPLLGCAEDCDRKLFDRLRRGRIEADATADLHGMRKAEAREELIRVLQQAWRDGDDCVLVIHGRALRSESEPVLKRALPDWLTTQPLAARVLAFAPAAPDAGGAGATCVLLRSA